jgi:hypothetical protein
MGVISSNIKYRTSKKQKQANNFKRQIDIMDTYDTYYGTYRDHKMLTKYKINYDLMNGRLDTTLYKVEDTFKIDGELVTLDMGEVPHNPIISQVCKTLDGENRMYPFKLSVKEVSEYSESLAEEEYRKMLKDSFDKRFIQPIKQAYIQNFMQQNQISNIAQLQPEIINQIEQEANNNAKVMTPKDITEYMQNDYLSPIAKQAQELINWFELHFDLKRQYDKSFVHMLATGVSCFYINIGTHGPEFEYIIPDEITYGGSRNKEWIQDMDWVRRETWMTIQEVTQKYGEYLRESHWKELERMLEPVFGTAKYPLTDDSPSQRKYQYEISVKGEELNKKFGSQDDRKKENFPNIAAAKAYIEEQWGSDVSLYDFGIRVCHFVWKDKRKMYKVFRINEEGGIDIQYRTEDYVENIEKDILIKEIWVDVVWEGTKLGTNDPIYLNIRELPYQWKNIDSPYDVELPYVGKAFNTYNNRSLNVSIVDLGKQFQRDVDMELAQLKKDLRTNTGQVFVFLKSMKPDNMTWSDFLNVAKDHNLLLIETQKRGFGNVDPQLIKSVNMSKMSDIVGRIQMINDMIERLYKAMGFNSVRIGQVGQYAGQSNISSQQQSSYNQTEPMFDSHREVFEKSVNRLINISRPYFKENMEKLKNVLSATSYEELRVGYPFWYSEFNVKIENSGKMARQIEFLRNQLQAFIQNGMSPGDIVDLSLAETRTDLINIMKRVDKKQQMQLQQSQQIAQQQFEQQQQLEAQKHQQDLDIRYKMHLDVLNSQQEREIIRAQTIANANDINKDGIHDLKESKELQLKFEREKLAEEVKLKNRELDIKANSTKNK